MRLHAIIPGPPRPKERPRKGASGRFYTPQATKAAELSIADHIRVQNRQAEPGGTARFQVDIHFYCDRRPDIDNLLKTVLDGVTQSCTAWLNDNQVDVLHAVRSRPGPTGPHTELTITKL